MTGDTTTIHFYNVISNAKRSRIFLEIFQYVCKIFVFLLEVGWEAIGGHVRGSGGLWGASEGLGCIFIIF